MADEPIAVDGDYHYESDNAYSPDDFDWQSTDTKSIGSSIYEGLISNGRRYQSLRNKEYIIPSDELQFETYEAGHLVDMILNYHKANPLFSSPIGKNPDDSMHILDIGTGKGTWAMDVADRYPNSTVRGVDLYPPPVVWTPPNCVFEVDDILEEWTWREEFDLIHMANMIGSFDSSEWTNLYQQCYNKLKPGGWLEQFEIGPFVESDDGSLPPDSALASWGRLIKECGERAGRSCEIISTMSSSIRQMGFVDVHERVYKWPIGPWPKDERIKEAGFINVRHWMSGMEGWCMWLLTNYGTPKPWTKEEVYVFCAEVRNEIRQGKYHCYHKA
ncbi:uncharacterized protein N7483_001958 [Penicillium malachiteum]|uniref:uncharacterized protein n=1 Tax=Penicillium malachiteum TaxID=1324776 RepID=UPI002549003F|nr:uncharacterized protein N7483_001958 [Penicillium malachiteum]KAJ5736833.1 hypothetical protein N7483_001958 [Penicillium malachiteum]